MAEISSEFNVWSVEFANRRENVTNLGVVRRRLLLQKSVELRRSFAQIPDQVFARAVD